MWILQNKNKKSLFQQKEQLFIMCAWHDIIIMKLDTIRAGMRI